jgi:acyl-CoA reductase-like NAD-dependent aldehyde dehydrogenase
VRDAVVAARKAFAGWSTMTAYNRGQVLYRLAEMMEARADDLAAVCCLVRRLGRQARAGSRLLESGRRAVLQLHRARADRGRRDSRA